MALTRGLLCISSLKIPMLRRPKQGEHHELQVLKQSWQLGLSQILRICLMISQGPDSHLSWRRRSTPAAAAAATPCPAPGTTATPRQRTASPRASSLRQGHLATLNITRLVTLAHFPSWYSHLKFTFSHSSLFGEEKRNGCLRGRRSRKTGFRTDEFGAVRVAASPWTAEATRDSNFQIDYFNLTAWQGAPGLEIYWNMKLDPKIYTIRIT